jgi:cell fate (sporulation/competence/biofilm development) regulator YlbF (YheA/YmcA/DUF963 family)
MASMTPLSIDIAQATEAFGQNLAYSAPFLQYHAAEEALVADTAAYSLLQELAQLQGNLRLRQSQGTLSASDLENLRRLQADVQANAVIADYFRAQQDVTAYIQTLNEQISSLLGVNFAGLARVPGSC